MKLKLFCYILVLSSISIACNQTSRTKDNTKSGKKATASVKVPDFNADSAYQFIVDQVNFGPRVPNTEAHRSAGVYLADQLRKFSDTLIIQNFKTRAYDGTVLSGKNLIGSFNLSANSRIMLCAHWDTRPYADHDPNPTNHNTPIDGANDGGSGVGILLEIARLMAIERPKTGVDIILFDAEDYGPPQDHQKRTGENWWALGSQYWANNPHDYNYSAKFAILLDMVGAHDARFYMEGYSMTYAPGVLKNVWNTAHRIGYKNYFLFEQQGYIDDDHKAINEVLKIPAIDIIHLDETSSNSSFFEHWHTVNDKLDIISKESLKVVGQTVMTVVYEQK